MKQIVNILFFLLLPVSLFAAEKKDSIGLKGNRSSVYFGGGINYLYYDNYTTLYPDSFGELVQGCQVTTDRTTFDFSGQAKGIYFVKIQNEQGTQVKKMVLQ